MLKEKNQDSQKQEKSFNLQKDKIHVPIFCSEISSKIQCGGICIDCTFGRGGHSSIFLDKCEKVIAIDRDVTAVQWGKKNFKKNISFHHSLFSKIDVLLSEEEVKNITNVIVDLGFSSDQLSEDRGFSYMKESKLDMRMGFNCIDACKVINRYKQSEISQIIRYYGEDKNYNKISAAIVKNRPIYTTTKLKEIIFQAAGKNFKSLSRVFQAFRIYVNQEIYELEILLKKLNKITPSGSRVFILTFHSLEDRLVKREFKKKEWKNYGFILPSSEEILLNRKCKSAKLRWAEKK